MKEKLLSAALKKKRKEIGLTQEKMAPLLGLGTRQYQSYERGEYEADKETIDEYLSKLASLKPISISQTITQTNNQNTGRQEYETSPDGLYLKVKILETEKQGLEQKVIHLEAVNAMLQEQVNKLLAIVGQNK